MRMKQVWTYIPIPAKLKLFWARVTFSRITTFYLVFSILHCIVQVILQVQAFSTNAQAASLLADIIKQGNASEPGFFVMGKQMRLCETIPTSFDTSSCAVVWDPSSNNSTDNYLNGTSQNAAANAGSLSLSSTVSSATPVSSISSLADSSISAASPTPAMSLTADPSVLTSSLSATSTSTLASLLSVASASTIHRTVTITVKPSVTAVDNVQHAASAISSTTTVIVTVRPTPTSITVSANSSDLHTETSQRKRLVVRDGVHVVSTLTVNGQTSVDVSIDGDIHSLSRTCLVALNWPTASVDNTKRQDIVFIAFQLWVLGMSLVALLNESMPHIIAALLTHVLATVWGGIQISSTATFHSSFTLITQSACHTNLLPQYWKERQDAELPSLILNVVALLVSAFLSWRLMKSFGWQTFKRVGASLTINRVYSAVLILSIVIQLSAFFIFVSAALWFDQLVNGDIGRLSHRSTAFKAVIIIVLVLLLPWLAVGWISVRREYKIPMLVFLIFAFLYMVGWSLMFVSPAFRWTFVQWRFFTLMASASALLALTTCVLGVLCRINFGKGLPRYLQAEEEHQEGDFYPVAPGYNEKWDDEKAAFPETDTPLPTYSAAFGRGPEVPPPVHMNFGPRVRGPRFYNNSEPFEPQPIVRAPARSLSNASYNSIVSAVSSKSGAPLDRVNTHSSGRSNGSNDFRKRWVIE